MPSEVRGIDAGTIAFRRLLGEAGGRDQARIDTLVALGRRTVFVVTWSGGEALRTLTNAGGETALPLFTGPDVMRVAASRFGWLNPDGSIESKEIGAREALRYALDQSVGFVVVDLSSDHATEFTHDEVDSLLGQQRAGQGVGAYAAVGTASEMIRRAVRQSSRPVGGADGFRESVPPPPRVPSELSQPPARANGGAVGRGAAQPADPDMPDSLRRSVTGAPPPPQPSLDGPLPEMPGELRRSVAGATAPSERPAAGGGGGAHATMLQAAPRAAATGAKASNATVLQAPGSSMSAGRAPSVSGARAPSVSGARAPSVSGARAPSVSGARAPSVSEARAPSVSGARAPSVSGASALAQPPPLVTPFEVAARAQSEPAPRARSERPPPRSPVPEPAAEAEAEVPSSAPPEASPDALRSPITLLDEVVLERMAEALRRYPEVEWACELADEDGNPVVGLRVDPSFAGRTAEIGDALHVAARKARARIGVVLLVKPSQVRQGRALGRAFFPWRRKRG